MKKKFLVLLCCICLTKLSAQLNVQASYDLIKRTIPQYVAFFKVESLQQNEKDVFEIESKNNRVVLRGNNGVAVASALYYFLRNTVIARLHGTAPTLSFPNNCRC